MSSTRQTCGSQSSSYKCSWTSMRWDHTCTCLVFVFTHKQISFYCSWNTHTLFTSPSSFSCFPACPFKPPLKKKAFLTFSQLQRSTPHTSLPPFKTSRLHKLIKSLPECSDISPVLRSATHCISKGNFDRKCHNPATPLSIFSYPAWRSLYRTHQLDMHLHLIKKEPLLSGHAFKTHERLLLGFSCLF